MKWYQSTENAKWVEKTYIPAENKNSFVNFTADYDQTIDGFGGCFNELSQIAKLTLSQEKQDEIMDLLFAKDVDGLNFNFCRMPIGASDYAEIWYSHNETDGDYAMENFSIARDEKYMIPYMNEAFKRNENIKIFASPWSPPSWMKFPKVYNFGKLVWTKENLTAYALYFAKFVEAYKEKGIKIDQLHIQNEIMADQKFPSCLWTGEEMCEFVSEYLGPLFEERGIDTEIWMGTLNASLFNEWHYKSGFNGYANVLMHDEKARKYTKGIAYQWVGKYVIEKTHKVFPDLKLIQSENECGDGANTWDYAKYINELFHHYLSNGVNGYVYWNMILKQGGESTWGWKQNSMITIENGDYHLNHEYYVMKHYSSKIQEGAKRIVLQGDWSGNTVAFENPNGEVVFIVSNPFKKTMNVEFTVKNETYTFELEGESINTMIM